MIRICFAHKYRWANRLYQYAVLFTNMVLRNETLDCLGLAKEAFGYDILGNQSLGAQVNFHCGVVCDQTCDTV